MGKELNSHHYFKGKYYIVFYDESGEEFRNIFSNVIQIVKARGLELTPYNINLTRVELTRALKRENHKTRILNDEIMTVHLVDVEDID